MIEPFNVTIQPVQSWINLAINVVIKIVVTDVNRRARKKHFPWMDHVFHGLFRGLIYADGKETRDCRP